MLKLGDIFPNFSVDTTHGSFTFHEWIGENWAMLVSHPADFTPVCTTELGRMAQLIDEFVKRNVKVIALSCDSVTTHHDWIKDIKCYAGVDGDWPYPIIADPKRELADKLGMLDPVEVDVAGAPLTCRAVFVIGPDKRLKASILYPATTGRNFDEILRLIDSLQLTVKHPLATPADWKRGSRCMIVPSLSKAEADQLYPNHIQVKVPSGMNYIRLTDEPK